MNKKIKPEKCNTKVITWEELVAHEPELNDLLIEARSIKPGPDFCKHDTLAIGYKQHRGFKKSLHKLVGFGSRHPYTFLATSQAWDVAIETILESMPPCTNCGCESVDDYLT